MKIFLLNVFCRYADLKNNRLTNYTFNFDQMLNDKVPIAFFFFSFFLVLLGNLGFVWLLWERVYAVSVSVILFLLRTTILVKYLPFFNSIQCLKSNIVFVTIV